MTTVFMEVAVPLEMLDGHLKAIMRLKLREFLHLDPCMKDIPSINPEAYSNRGVAEKHGYLMIEQDMCPNKSLRSRRRQRTSVLLSG